MDDKWFAFVDDDRLHLHRSWTGVQEFQADFQPCDGGRRIAKVAIESSRRRYRRRYEDSDRLLLELLIDTVLLGSYDVSRWRHLYEQMT
ncbi:8-oxo-dGTP diphosphatase [Nonomuraea solani]|uniref:8-oxo-dGTP diphosphatase n=2 Tax=Nonomuraea solani TaxID=1144553 RepID=A0A1H6ESV1_9ACTN|nr:8-oxo-dGTP diphosphatase [Nonomuraea solani]